MIDRRRHGRSEDVVVIEKEAADRSGAVLLDLRSQRLELFMDLLRGRCMPSIDPTQG